MRIGVPKEIKNHEYRAGLTPAGARVLAAAGHEVWIETRAGAAVGLDDAAYRAAGAQVVATAAEVYAADLVIKVKELQPAEFALTHPGQILFCYQHLAPAPALLSAMLERNVSCVAYETVTAADGSLPLLTPMSEIAGRLAPQEFLMRKRVRVPWSAAVRCSGESGPRPKVPSCGTLLTS